MKMRLIALILALASGAVSNICADTMPEITGETFADSEGKHINAHGGNILFHNGTYYWYGEHRGAGTPGNGQEGVMCYASRDLHIWHNNGIVLSVSDEEGSPLERGGIIERPKVVFNPHTGKFVMWFHHELKGQGYGAAHSAVAVADSATGPFSLLHTGRVNPGIYPANFPEESKEKTWPDDMKWWTPEWYTAINDGMFTKRDLEGGQMARDMTIFVDDDGTAYHIYSSEDNLTLQIAELDSTYTRHTGNYIRIFPGGHNEAPAIFKRNGTYWMITSGCTGWEPNEARLMKADSIMGEWTMLPNPCRGEGAEKTFDAQGTYIMNIDGNFTFMADIWNPRNLADSRYLWLPIQFDDNGTPFIAE